MSGSSGPQALAALAELSRRRRLRAEAGIVSDLIDAAYYRLHYAALIPAGETPAEHFARTGWRHLLKPSADFDVWWYWVSHLDPAADDLNPLVHYALLGRERGLSTRPESLELTPGQPLAGTSGLRRATLFAAYDADGIVDATTIRYVAELARHGDVFVLYDGYVAPAELAKLDGIAAGAWAVRHGAYDFGSYSMLARDLVGWERLQSYDEVLFVNDSCYLLRPLDEVFARMDARGCAWWGLQATKGLASTREAPSNAFTEPIPLAEVKRSYLERYEADPVYDFHLGSYFLAFRREVLQDPAFRRLVDSVRPEPSKLLIVEKYEIGLSHLLLGRGHDFDTFIDALHPFHPIFTETYFTLLGQGYPLLKKYFLYQNHYDVPGLSAWKERIRAQAPEAPVEEFEANLRRTSPDDRLQRSFAITRAADGRVQVPTTLAAPAYRRRNRKTPKRADLWVFPVDPDTHELSASSRAVLEAVRHDDAITPVVLTRSRRVHLEQPGLVVAPLQSPAGQQHLLEAGVILASGAPRAASAAPVDAGRQTIVVMRDGLNLERTGRAALTESPRPARPDSGPALVHPSPPDLITGIPVASDLDTTATLACHWPATYGEAWRTGIPAHDLLFAEDAALPGDTRAQAAELKAELAGRRLLLFAPSARRTAESYSFGAAELDWLRSWAAASDAVIGIRGEDRDLAFSYLAQMQDFALDLSRRRFASVHAVLRKTSALVTDYSGRALDFATTGRPVVSFAPDLADARDRLLFDLDHIFPGRVAQTFDELTDALARLDEPTRHQALQVQLLVDRTDAANTARLVSRIAAEARTAPDGS